MGTTQISVRLEEEILEQLDKFVDGLRYRSRAQILIIALTEWLEEHGADLTLWHLTTPPPLAEDCIDDNLKEESRVKSICKGFLREMMESGEFRKLMLEKSKIKS
jgi:Arc/MetJ-type ribon-helix-helix transcriptional regulator